MSLPALFCVCVFFFFLVPHLEQISVIWPILWWALCICKKKQTLAALDVHSFYDSLRKKRKDQETSRSPWMTTVPSLDPVSCMNQSYPKVDVHCHTCVLHIKFGDEKEPHLYPADTDWLGLVRSVSHHTRVYFGQIKKNIYSVYYA